MKNLRLCKHCSQQFLPRRTNHLYCQPSCRTKASYRRNNYQYISGHYKKIDRTNEETNNQLGLIVPDKIQSQLQAFEKKLDMLSNTTKTSDAISAKNITNVAIGTAAADATIYSAKKLFAPNSLPATKGDVSALKSELNALKTLLQQYLSNY